ncbi:MAG TPA: polysaccharide biosynthesis/export family protein [Planctomycetota bacterium]
MRTGPLPGPALVTSAEPYRLQPGDELELRFFHTPELDLTLPVRPDGSISIPLVHEVRVAGRTVEEVRLELTERYAGELAEPELVVIVRAFARYPVHVGGEVARPGVLELSGPRTVLEAVLAAGGWLTTARLAEVVVVRRHESGGHELVTADLGAVLAGRDGRGNFALRPWDVVFVPSSPIADVNRWVDQYIRQNIPITFSYRLDTSD